MKVLNIRVKSTRFLGENIQVNLCDFEFGNCFLDMTLKEQVTKGKINKMDFNKMKKKLVYQR